MRQLIGAYYQLTKPGIIYGNVLTAAGGFLFAAKGNINCHLLLATLVGTSLVIASACVFNNLTDRTIDRLMSRTRRRALISGTISGRSAVVYATVLGCIGISVLVAGTNSLVVVLGIVGFLAYVILYGYTKRRTVHGTLVGTISGATPIIAGYCAVTGRLDTAALLLFLIMVFWQMPHFYAIAMYRHDDYAAAHIPVLPVAQGMWTTKIHILIYLTAFMLAVAALTLYGSTGYSFLVLMLGIGGYWLWRGIQGFNTSDNARWARSMFGVSLLVLLTLSAALAVDPWLP